MASHEAYLTISLFTKRKTRQDKRGNSTTRSYINGLVNISSIMAVRIAIATGMRRGEILGLMWKDIAFGEIRELSVKRAYTLTLRTSMAGGTRSGSKLDSQRCDSMSCAIRKPRSF